MWRRMADSLDTERRFVIHAGSPSGDTITPSRITSVLPMARPIRRTSGNDADTSLPSASLIVTTPPDDATSDRQPCHSTSNAHPFSFGKASGTAWSRGMWSGNGCRVGSTGGSMRWMIQSRPRVGNSAYLPAAFSPWNVTMTLSSVNFSVSYVPESQMNMSPAP